MIVKIINKSNNPLPVYETEGSAGMDLAAWLSEPIVIKPGERRLIPTGLYISLPKGKELQVRPRSGLAIKNGISIVNAPGTVDSDYRGEIGVILINLGQEDFTVKSGDRIAQAVVADYTRVEWELVEVLDETERGDGAYGHTGV